MSQARRLVETLTSKAFARALLSVALTIVGTSRALASTGTVPDDFPTVQAAIDAGMDTVSLRSGEYAEVVQAYRGVTLVGVGDQRPRLKGLAITNPYYWLSRSWSVSGIDFADTITVRTTNWQARYCGISFDHCALPGGLQHDIFAATDPYDISGLDFAHCRIGGGINAMAAFVSMVSDTIAGGVNLESEDEVDVQSCWFTGGPGAALTLHDQEPTGLIEGNVIEHYQWGTSVSDSHDLMIRNNVVRDMTETGIGVRGMNGTISGNSVTTCRTGIGCAIEEVVLTDNTVLHSREVGVLLYSPTDVQASNNVIGRSGDTGLFIEAGGFGNFLLAHNTVFENGGPGVLIWYGVYNRATLLGNIFYSNAKWGLQTEPLISLTLSCNDWFANELGAVTGAQVSDLGLTLDPLFCDVTQDDVHLSAGSPLLRSAGCDSIGALGQGCDAQIVARLTTFTAASATDGVEVRWQVADAAPGFAAWVERADDATGPWSKVQGEPVADGDATVQHDHSTEPARSYWYRVVATDRGTTRALGDPLRVETNPPQTFALLSTGRNPSPGALEATFQLAHAADITLELFDTQGRRVATLAHGTWPAGIHKASLVGTQPASGAYFIRYRHPQGEDLRRVAIVR